MSLINFSNIQDTTTIDAADVNTPLNTIFNDYNGNIDSTNIKAASITNAALGIAAVKSQNIDFTTIIAAQQAWQAIPLSNSWVNFGSGNATALYMKDSLGFVHVQGLVAGGTVGTVIGTLPAGYRPASIIRLTSDGASDVLGIFSINSSGQITHITGGNAFFGIFCSFRAEV